MTLFSYVVRHDNGFSPNPFFGYCTLACCKPSVRRVAQRGDWVIGLAPKAQGSGVVYFMRVDETMEIGSYWRDERFKDKKPRFAKEARLRCGDNIYQPVVDGEFHQIPSFHSNGAAENERLKSHDLAGRNVLVSETFAYFGDAPRNLPVELEELIVGRGHRSRFSEETKTKFLDFVRRARLGVHGPPRHWPANDDSWEQSSAGCGGDSHK